MLRSGAPHGTRRYDLAVVVPAFNEAAVLPAFTGRLRAVCDQLNLRYEVLIVDDGSTDGTAQVLATIARGWPQLRPLVLRANVGHQMALTAGLDHSDADNVVSLDADLQDPPEVIPRLLALRTSGVDVVYAQRRDRSSDRIAKRVTAGLYYRGIRRLTGVGLLPHVGDFRLLSGDAVDELRRLPQADRIYRLLIPAMGFRAAVVPYTRDARAGGVSKYPPSKMVRLAADSVICFSVRPLRLAVSLGLAAGGACLALAGWALANRVGGHTVPGWTSLTMAVLGVGAAQLVCTGFIGEYLARICRRLDGRAPYSVAPSVGHIPKTSPDSCPGGGRADPPLRLLDGEQVLAERG